MTDQQPSPPSGPSPKGPSPTGQSPTGQSPNRNPWVTALLILIGIILLLPGLCSVILTGIMIGAGGPRGDDSDFLPMLIGFFLVGVGGVALIVFAIRRKS
jgi:hypothetical protein